MIAQSSLEELNTVIQSENPFDGRSVVRYQQVWGEEFPDVPSLHAHASDTVIKLINKINSQHLSTFGVTLLAPKGTGKSHVLSRIRHHLQSTNSGLFIYLCEYGNLNHIKYQFLQNLAASLRKRGSQGLMQCQELATVLVNQTLQKNFTPLQLVRQLQQVLTKNSKAVTQLTEKLIPKLDSSNPHIIQAILWTLSPTHAPFAINWLAGRELTQAQADVLGLPNPTYEDKEIAAFTTTCEILNLISHYGTPVICFDELDGAEMVDEEVPLMSGYTRAMIVASFAKDLYNNLHKGLIITSMYEQTFKNEVRALPRADAILDRIAQEVIELQLLKSGEVVELVAGWLEDFYARHGIIPPHKVYPFDEKELKEKGHRSTVREVLRWCAESFGKSIDIQEKIERVYRELEESVEDFLEDNEKIANAIALGIQHLKGQTLENLTVEDVVREVLPKAENKGFIQFRVLGKENGKAVKIGICVLQNSNSQTIAAALKRLTQYKTFDLTRGCLVRTKAINENWAAYQDLQKLLNQMGGEWVVLKEEEIRPLIALRSILKDLESYDFQEDHVHQFIDQNRLLIDNPLIREILSDPSGQLPQDAVDEDVLIATPNTANGESSDVVTALGDGNDSTLETGSPVDTSLLSRTQLATLQLHQQGLSIAKITKKRSLSRSTITRHFVDMIEMNQPIDLDLLVPAKRQIQIRKAIEKTANPSFLKSIREHLSDSYTYDEIQLVRAKWLLEKQATPATK